MSSSLLGSYIPKDNSLQSETVHYKRGVCQQFCLPSHTVDPSEWTEEEVSQAWHEAIWEQIASSSRSTQLARVLPGPNLVIPIGLHALCCALEQLPAHSRERERAHK